MSEADWPTIAPGDVPWLDTDQMVEVDRVMIEDLHIELIQMMENAGRGLARLVESLYSPGRVAVYAGTGGNGGGGLVAARHLVNHGIAVTVVTARPSSDFGGIPSHQLDIIDRMGVRIVDHPVEADVAVDALIGYSLQGAPRGLTQQLIDALDSSAERLVSLDAPSGLDTATGEAPGSVVHADATFTLALPKIGLRGHPAVGRLFVGDISVPPLVYQQMGLGPVNPFATSPIVEIVEI